MTVKGNEIIQDGFAFHLSTLRQFCLAEVKAAHRLCTKDVTFSENFGLTVDKTNQNDFFIITMRKWIYLDLLIAIIHELALI